MQLVRHGGLPIRGSKHAAARLSSTHCAKQSWLCCKQPVVTAAAAAELAATADQVVLNAVPYISTAAPKLTNRSMVGSPMDGLWSAAASAMLRLELMAAAAVDKHDRAGPAVMAALAGIVAGMGIDAFTLLQYGLPPYFPDLLLAAFSAWDTTPWALFITAVAIPVTAWAFRAWWLANTQLLSREGGPVQQLLQKIQQQFSQQQHQQASEQQQQQQELATRPWVAAVVAIARAVCLSSAVSSFTQCTLSTSPTAIAVAAATGLAAAAVAAAPILLLVLPSAGAAKASSSSSNAKPDSLAANVLLAEVSWVLAMVGVAPVFNAAAAAGLAYSLLHLHKQAVAPRLARFVAAVGDEVEVHLSLKLAGSSVAFDSTLAETPLRVIAAQRSKEHVEYWEEASSGEFWDTAGSSQQQQQQQDEQADDTTTTSSSSISSLRELQTQLRGWVATPAARWDALLPFVADAACGMHLGETRSLQLFNPSSIGYFNPSYSWWQPTADVAAKFKGLPGAGDVFYYPVADGAYLPTRVAAVGERYVELDANYGVVDTQLQLDVQLVRLHKQ